MTDRPAPLLLSQRAALFSTTFRYALISLLELAQSRQFIQAGAIAKQCSLSPHYLSVVLRDLRKLGLVESQKGNRGGYRLICHPDQINLLQLHRSLAGAHPEVPAISDKAEASTRADHWLQTVSERWCNDLARTSLADLLQSTVPGL